MYKKASWYFKNSKSEKMDISVSSKNKTKNLRFFKSIAPPRKLSPMRSRDAGDSAAAAVAAA
jgi:hypothetical protein